MPTIQLYISEDDYRGVLTADVKNEDGQPIGPGEIAHRLLRWFLKAPEAPLRRSALGL